MAERSRGRPGGVRDGKLDLASVRDGAREIERLGFDGFVTGEIKTDPFIPLALAATTTERISLTTAVAIAFPRSPTVTAMMAWDLQALSGGRFILGLGTQVKGHVERRYGTSWAPPVPRLREYLRAVRAVWDCWQNGTPLDVRGTYYNLSVMVPLFNPGPIPHPQIPIHLAAINTHICQLAGEMGDGIRPHPITTRKFITEVMLPNVALGARRAGRSLQGFEVALSPLVAVGDDAREFADARCSRPTGGGASWRRSTNCPSRSGGRRCPPTSRTAWLRRSPSSAPTTTARERFSGDTATSRRGSSSASRSASPAMPSDSAASSESFRGPHAGSPWPGGARWCMGRSWPPRSTTG